MRYEHQFRDIILRNCSPPTPAPYMPSSRLKIAYLSSADPLDKTAWSGIHFNLFSSLQKHVGDVTALGPWKPDALLKRGRWYSFLLRKLTGKRFSYHHSLAVSKAYGKHFSEMLRKEKFDLIFAVAASSELAFLDTNIPIYSLADATFANMVDYYPFYTHLLNKSVKDGNEIGQRALSKSKRIFFPSQWAIDSANQHYKQAPEKMELVKLGANLEEIPLESEVLSFQNEDKCRLLFIGVEWERKGGPIAIETLKELRQKGLDAQLTIIGCDPQIDDPNIRIIPFLNKKNVAERKELHSIFSSTDFFILPTKAECFGVVFCEASAFGVPSLASDTGGVNGAVENGRNGFLFPVASNGKVYAEKIMELFLNEEKYLQLRKSSRAMFDEELNWEVFGEKIRACVEEDFRLEKSFSPSYSEQTK